MFFIKKRKRVFLKMSNLNVFCYFKFIMYFLNKIMIKFQNLEQLVF